MSMDGLAIEMGAPSIVIPNPPSVWIGTTELVPVSPPWYPYLYGLAVSGPNAMRWRYRGQIPAFELFVQQLHADVLCQFIVRLEGEPAGLVVAYNADLRNGHCYVAAVVEPVQVGHGFGAAGLEALCAYVFRTWNFRKVYAEVPSFILEPMSEDLHKLPMLDQAFEIEGCLRQHLYVDGAYWDMYLVSMDRGHFSTRVGQA